MKELEKKIKSIYEDLANDRINKQTSTGLPCLIIKVPPNQGRDRILQFITHELETREMATFFGRNHYILLDSGSCRREIIEMETKVKLSASLSNSYTGILGIDMTSISRCSDASDVMYFIKTVFNIKCTELVLFYSENTDRMANIIAKIEECPKNQKTVKLSLFPKNQAEYVDIIDDVIGEHWSNPESIKLATVANSAGVPLLTEGKTMYCDPGEANVLISGTTGSGKTAYSIKPLIYNLINNKESIIFIDRKRGILDMIQGLDRNKLSGYKVKIIDMWDIVNSEKVNLLSEIYTLWKLGTLQSIKLASELLSSLAYVLYPDNLSTDEVYWALTARSAFIGAVYAVFEIAENEDEVNLVSVYNLIATGNEPFSNGKTVLAELVERLNNPDITTNISSFLAAPKDTTYACIKSFILNGLSLYVSDEASRIFFSKDDLRINELKGDEPTIIAISLPDFTSRYDAAGSVIIDQLIRHYTELAEKSITRRLDTRVNIVLEELGDVGKTLPNLPQTVCTARSRNMKVYMVVQSVGQLSALFGKESADTILDNTDIKIMFRSNHYPSLVEVASSLGNKVVRINGNSISLPLASPSDLNALGVGQALITVKGRFKYVTQLTRYDKLFKVNEKIRATRQKDKAVSKTNTVPTVNTNHYLRQIPIRPVQTMGSRYGSNGKGTIIINGQIFDMDSQETSTTRTNHSNLINLAQEEKHNELADLVSDMAEKRNKNAKRINITISHIYTNKYLDADKILREFTSLSNRERAQATLAAVSGSYTLKNLEKDIGFKVARYLRPMCEKLTIGSTE